MVEKGEDSPRNEFHNWGTLEDEKTETNKVAAKPKPTLLSKIVDQKVQSYFGLILKHR